MDRPISAIQLATLLLATIVVADAIRRYIHKRAERKGHPLPPGLTPIPLIGSKLSLDNMAPWLTYTEWQAKYGDIMYVRLLDTDTIVLNSYSVATERLEKRSQVYSDRPFITTMSPYGHDCNFAFSRYGEHWRLCRRIFHQTFRAEAALTFRPTQVWRARELIVNMIEDPEGYLDHCPTFSSAVAMSCVYDYEPKARNDPMVSDIHDFLKVSAPELTAEKAVVLKAFPFLLYVPGSWIRRKARETRKLGDRAIDMPYQYVMDRVASKDAMNTATVIDHIARMGNLDDSYRAEYETALKHASLSAYMGSAETVCGTSTAIMTFTLAMVKNPRVWKRAQEEIDAALEKDRLPEFEDGDSLPHIEAIVRKTFRWKPVAPLGVAHATKSSDIFHGFYIPKGATIVTNIWAMAHDKARYSNPEVFRPERFLDAQGNLIKDDPRKYVFGFGRRVCPGRHAANASIWIAIATILATLDFDTAKDEAGNDVVFEPKFTSGITHRPFKFPCRLTPRAHITINDLEGAILGH